MLTPNTLYRCSLLFLIGAVAACDQSAEKTVSAKPQQQVIQVQQTDSVSPVLEKIDNLPANEVKKLEESIESLQQENAIMRQHRDTLLLKIREQQDQPNN